MRLTKMMCNKVFYQGDNHGVDIVSHGVESVGGILDTFMDGAFRAGAAQGRGFFADSRALLIACNPDERASALKKTDIMRSDSFRDGNAYINHMFSNQPLRTPGSLTGWLIRLFRIHQRVDERLERLRSMA